MPPAAWAALGTLLVFLPALLGRFAWDDTDVFVNSPLYRDPALWREALLRPFVIGDGYVRPLAVLTFLLDAHAAGGALAWRHAVNVLLHAVNAGLVAWLASSFLGGGSSARRGARGAGLAYGLHPALVEPAAWICGRFDLLATTCVLLALTLDRRLDGRGMRRVLAVGACAAGALLAKESAIALVAILPLAHVAWRGARRTREDARVAAGIAGAVAVALVLRVAVLGRLALPAHAADTGAPLAHALLVARSLAAYAAVTVWPFTAAGPVHAVALPVRASDPRAWLAVAVALALVVGLLVLARRARGPALLGAAAVLALLPVLNVFPLDLAHGALFAADRFLALPLALVALALAPAFAWAATRPAGRAAIAAWLVACAIAVEIALPHWRDDAALWTWAARRAPDSPVTWINLSRVHGARGAWDDVLADADRAIALGTADAGAWNNRGTALEKLGRLDDARAAFREAAARDPRDPVPWTNLAVIDARQGRPDDARRTLVERALAADPRYGPAQLELGLAWIDLGRPDEAEAPLVAAERLLPPADRARATEALAHCREPLTWLEAGDRLRATDPVRALAAFERAGALGAAPEDVAYGRALVLTDRAELGRAADVLRAALAGAPRDPRLHDQLGLVAAARGDRAAAREHFTRAAALAGTSWDVPRKHLAMLGER